MKDVNSRLSSLVNVFFGTVLLFQIWEDRLSLETRLQFTVDGRIGADRNCQVCRAIGDDTKASSHRGAYNHCHTMGVAIDPVGPIDSSVR
jgi:hypothetical protein